MSLNFRAGALAFLTASVTLIAQILVHRMVSVKLINNYAFLVISLTMLGFAFSGVLLSRWLPQFLETLEDALSTSAALFAITIVAVSSFFYHLEGGVQFVETRPDLVLRLLHWIPVSLLYAIPFTFCGLMLGALLSSSRFLTRQIYFADLVGSALGAFVAIPAISFFGVETSMLIACALLLAGTPALFRPKRRLTPLLLGTAALFLVLSMAFPNLVFNMNYPDGSILAANNNPESGWKLEHVVWDPLARIEVTKIPPPDPRKHFYPSLIGKNRTFLANFKRIITQNNNAFTYAVHYDGNMDSLTGIEETIYSAAYQATSMDRPKVAVLGVGGGFDILTALAFDASDITGVEVNSATVTILKKTYRDYFRSWADDPRVRIVHGEGRHFLATNEQRYDILQLSGVDSYSGTPGAAHVFSENYLYTAEAFDLYFSRLTDNGILCMMRLEFPEPREMLRALVTAAASLRRSGASHPAQHIVMTSQSDGMFTALLAKKTPFTREERQRLAVWAADNEAFAISASPELNHHRANVYQTFLSLASPVLQRLFVEQYPFDISPTSDNRPFFFRYSFWWHLFPRDGMIWTDSLPFMEISTILLTMITGLAVVFCIYLPLRFFASKALPVRNAWRYTVFFAGTGLAYLAIEIALLQKFGLFLGHPNYALSVVLAALLLATGLGSLFSQSVVGALGKLRFVAYLLAGLLMVEYALVFPYLLDLIGIAFWLRVLIVFGLVLPIGICLGTFVPTALEQLKSVAAPFVPWAWGVNGIFAVLAPVLSIAFSISWGSNALLLSAIPVYLAVGFSLPPPAK